MRLRTLFLLLLSPQLSASMGFFGELFGTSDFALLSQLRCARFIDYDDARGKCPIGLSDLANSDTSDKDRQCASVKPDTVRVHLVRDIHSKHAPRLLHVYVNKYTNFVNYGIETLSLPANATEWEVPKSVRETTYQGMKIDMNEHLEDSIFDTTANILYLIVRANRPEKTPNRRLTTVYVSNVFEGKTDFKTLDRQFVLHANTHYRLDWVENPYEHTVYYLNQSSSLTVLYKLPISELMTSLIDGKEGESLYEFNDPQRRLIFAHNDAFISLKRRDDDKIQQDIYFSRHNPSKENGVKGKQCLIKEDHVVSLEARKTRRVIVLFDWDYCMLKYGGDGKKNADGQKCPMYYEALADSDRSPSTSNTIYIVLVVLLAMMSLVLLVYVCWLRRNLDESIPRDEHKPVPYYPSGQPLDSTFDMSVDRWDQY